MKKMIIALIALLFIVQPFVESITVVPLPNDVTTTDFQNTCLNVTNMFRARHGVPAVTISSSLVTYCGQRIDSLQSCNLSPETCGGLNTGVTQQNFYYMPPGSVYLPTGTMALTAWYNEIYHYNYSKPGYNTNTAHFTNMVWKAVTTQGCCQKTGANFATMIVCLYQPPGNSYYQSAYPYNVLPLITTTMKKP